MPPAAKLQGMHVCPMFNGPSPHVGGAISGPGCPTVKIGGTNAVIMGDACACPGPPNKIILGSLTVKIGGKPAIRVGDSTSHGGTISPPGVLTVMIGG